MSLLSNSDHLDKAREEIIQLQEAFNTFDKMGEGVNSTISVAKLIDVLREYLGVGITDDDQIRDMIAAVDTSGSGTVSFAEFLTMMGEEKKKREVSGGDDHVVVEEELPTQPPPVFLPESVRNVFQHFDKNKDNMIGFDELKEVLAAHEVSYSDDEIRSLIYVLDPKGNGKISFPAFQRLMQTHD